MSSSGQPHVAVVDASPVLSRLRRRRPAPQSRGVRFPIQPMFSLSSTDMSFPIGVVAVTAAREGHEVVVRVTLAKEEAEGRFSDTSRAALLDELDQWLAFLAHSAGAPKGLPLSMWAR